MQDGFLLAEDWITEKQEKELVEFLDGNEWSPGISSKRLTQHYGYKYSISGYHEKDSKDWGVLDKYARNIEVNFPDIIIAQALANQYYPGVGIGAHKDKESPVVFGICLLNDCNMIFKKKDRKEEVLLPRRCLYVMSEEAATEWTHEIPARKYVYYPDGTKVKMGDDWRRISITFRHFSNTILQ